MRKLLSILTFLFSVTACIYPYTPELDQAPEGVLTVDASISIGETSTVLLGLLSSLYPTETTADLYENSWKKPDLNEAVVWVEDDAGEVYTGKKTSFPSVYYSTYFGTYAFFTIPTENAPEDRRYRLGIQVMDATYTSEWSDLLDPPVIRDILFTADDRFVNVSVSVDGGTEATGYLLLSYEETWEFHVDYVPSFSVQYDEATNYWNIQPSDRDYSRYWCWMTFSNDRSFPVDYTAMSSSGVTSFPLFRFSRENNRNHRRYCVNVKAKILSRETYRFLKNQEDNTEGGDNLFTPTPGEIASNIWCESDPERMVFGYALFSKSASKRAWLDSRYMIATPPFRLYYIQKDAYKSYYGAGYLPLEENEDPKENEGPFGWGPKRCYDCTAAGGSLDKPPYWDETE